MALDPLLLEILACPDDKGPLYYLADEDALYNPRLKRRYAIRDDIPDMIIEEAETVSATEHERILAKVESEGLRPTFEVPQGPSGPQSGVTGPSGPQSGVTGPSGPQSGMTGPSGPPSGTQSGTQSSDGGVAR